MNQDQSRKFMAEVRRMHEENVRRQLENIRCPATNSLWSRMKQAERDGEQDGSD